MKTFIVDIETDGFDPTTIHCVVCKDDQTNNIYEFRSDDRDDFVRLVSGHELVFHNGIGYDLPALEKVWQYTHTGPIVDTLVLSRLADPAQEGGHSLRNWGSRLGFPKGEHTDWSMFSPEMLAYCKLDVEVTQRVYRELTKLMKKEFSPQCVELEHRVAGIITNQTKNGWLFNEQDAVKLLSNLRTQMTNIEMEIHNEWKPMARFSREFRPSYTQSGQIKRVGLGFVDGDSSAVWSDLSLDGIDTGWCSVITWVPFNLGSRKQIAERLSLKGWTPTRFTEKGNPIVDESTLDGVDIPEAKLINEYLLLQKRVGMLNNWLDNLKDDGRLHGRVNTNGAITGRMTHSDPNLAQVPAGYSPYGKEMRSLFTVPAGYKLVGADAAQLELRMLAHYMNDKDYTNEILNGDVHTANQIAAGLDTRDKAKTFIYAFLYGAGDAKIGSIVGGSSSDGRVLKDRFLGNTPALAGLRQRVDDTVRQRGWLKGLDGRKLHIRSAHSALNTLLQSAGAVVMKQALVHLVDNCQLRYKLVGNIHDEIQAEVHEEDAHAFGQQVVQSIRMTEQSLGLRCPMDGSYSVGDNWSQTH
jgi:DNA polymerase-1